MPRAKTSSSPRLREAEHKVQNFILKHGIETVDELSENVLQGRTKDPELIKELITNIDDVRLRAAQVNIEYTENISCPACNSTQFSYFCGIIKCKKCNVELFIDTPESRAVCRNCIAKDLNECWVHHES